MNPFNEEQMAAMMYEAIAKRLKEKARPYYPEIDQLSEEESIEFCLAFGRAINALGRGPSGTD